MGLKSFVLTLAVLLLLTSCEEVAPDYSAQHLSLEELYESPGYPWFNTEVAIYNPTVWMVDAVRTGFDPNTQKILIFVKPSSICRGTTRLFPQVMKTLLAAGIDMTKVEVWSMRSVTDKQPYAPMITIVELPAVYVLRNDAVSASIPIQDYSYLNADTLIANAIAR